MSSAVIIALAVAAIVVLFAVVLLVTARNHNPYVTKD